MPNDAPRLILASGSPQRRWLLEQAGYDHRVVPPRPHAECGVCSKETPGELVARLALQKAADVRDQLGGSDQRDAIDLGDVIVGCDTVAECLGRILGKPAGRTHAEAMLRFLSGREHHVYSGLCIWPVTFEKPLVRVARTTLVMETLDDPVLQEYLESGLWDGKAGAFGYQDRVGWLSIVSGSESNVVGLPLELLGEMLSEAAATAQQPPSANPPE
jgi:septum formation protein